MANGIYELLVCDIETTGLHEDAYVLEVGFILLDKDLHEVARANWLVPSAATYTAIDEDLQPGARAMHEKNGLLAELAASYKRFPDSSAWTLESVQLGILEWLEGSGARAGQLQLIGKQVASFDAPRLANVFPLVGWLLSHRTIDISACRWLMQKVGYDLKKPESGHRVMGDCEQAAEELRNFVELIAAGKKASAPLVPASNGTVVRAVEPDDHVRTLLVHL